MCFSIMSEKRIDVLLWALPAWLVPLAALAAAEVAMRATGIQSDGLALPSQIVTALFALITNGEILLRTMETLGAIAVGVPAGAALGLALGVWLGLSPRAAHLASLSIELFRPIPPVAII